MVRRMFQLCLVVSFGLVTAAMVRAQAVPSERPSTYTIKAGDSIEVTYTYTPEYNETVSVPADGTVGLMRVGTVEIGGLTLSAATAVITEAASRHGLNEPEVFLTLRDYVRPQFTVLGEVNKPGKYDLHGTLRIADGLAVAGGLNGNARHKNIVIIHRLSETIGEATLYSYKELEKPKSEVSTETLKDGDIIVVPQGTLSKVERFVKIFNIGAYYPL